ncbi:unnamed protein product [Oppiella nova]|uniref:Arrestin C-terminal-like domain-containing protein n=1 Tax=Oppiella nova TaxID=334625 RepID=A0A7R9MDT3_9ACAR|nr:unnamed protein product [Oppiella nova]CAG2174518.1 unnamed protein product [Oppiella nova]
MDKIQLKDLDISLEGNKRNYMPGDTVNGTVSFTVTGGRMEVSKVRIALTCQTKTSWVENPGLRHHREGHTYSDQKTYIYFVYRIPDQSLKHLEPGKHQIPFDFKLPVEDIAPSYESDHGVIEYYVEVTIDETTVDEVQTVKTGITVQAPMRNNLHVSVDGTVEKVFTFPSVGVGSIKMYASVVKKGFESGHSIEVDCFIWNRSSLDATPRVTLYQTQVYMCGERHKAVDVALTDALVGQVIKGSATGMESFVLGIPQGLPLSFKSSLITVKYFAHLTLDIPYAIDLHINLPIVITTKEALNNEIIIT